MEVEEVKEEGKGILIRPGFLIPESELELSFAASSGPGGQKVNKAATKVRLKWRPLESAAVKASLPANDQERLLGAAKKHLAEDGSIQAVSDRFRTRESNLKECRRKLALRIRAFLKKPKKRIATRPTRAARERRLKEKKRTAEIKKSRRKAGPGEE